MCRSAFLLVAVLLTPTSGLILDGVWNLTNANQSIRVEGQVPGGVYSDLRAAGVLSQDVLHGFNDQLYRWVAYDNWTYTKLFQVEEAGTGPGEEWVLVLNGVDTVSTVRVNGAEVGRTDNMFVRYLLPVTQYLKGGENLVEVSLVSAVREAARLARARPHRVPPDCWPSSYHGECHVNQLRKMQASFAWDWGPAVPSQGIWKGAQLERCSEPLLVDVGTDVEQVEDRWRVTLKAWFEPCGSPAQGLLLAKMAVDRGQLTFNVTTTPTGQQPLLEARLCFSLPQDEVKVWWPNGYGGQYLYDLVVAFVTPASTRQVYTHIAFRSVRLVQDPVSSDPQQGLKFHFEVNGQEVFAKGSNWIPADVLPERSGQRHIFLPKLMSAADAHFNMLRVWGGGLYESDLFYEACDRLGIMLWHDLMFACNMYPAEEEFLSSVEVEVAQQVARLQHHPSIVLWAGNNENEVALRQNWYGTSANMSLYKSEYVKLYVETIRPIVERMDEGRVYLESSPSNGPLSERQGYIADDPQSPKYGDVHYYNYLGDMWRGVGTPRARFASEYGVQSLPSMSALEEAVPSRSALHLGSDWLSSRQHQPAGFFYLDLQMGFNLPKPTSLSHLVYLSQVNQAMSIKVESEMYRSQRSTLYSTGEGLTMGALYWQLNDIWTAPSWASIEYSGKWKMLHYFAKKFFAPVVITGLVSADDLVHVWVVSDLLQPLPQVQMTINVMSTQHLVPLKIITKIITVHSNSAEEVYTERVSAFTDLCPSHNDCFLTLQLTNATGNLEVPDNFLLLGRVRYMNLSQTDISVGRVKQVHPTALEFTLQTENFAAFVWLDHPSGARFSDNGFLMWQPTKTIKLTTDGLVIRDPASFISAMKVTHMKSYFRHRAPYSHFQ